MPARRIVVRGPADHHALSDCEAIGQPAAPIGAQELPRRSAAARGEIPCHRNLRARRLIRRGVEAAHAQSVGAAGAKSRVELVVGCRAGVDEGLQRRSDLRRRIAEPGIVARVGRSLPRAQGNLEIRIIRHPAIGLRMAVLPIGQVACILLADEGVERVVDFLLIAGSLRELELAPYRVDQLRLGAGVNGGVGVGVQQAAIGHADPHIAARGQTVEPQIAGFFLEINIALGRPGEGVDQAGGRARRVDHQRCGRAVADPAAFGRQGNDPARNQPLPAGRYRDATGGIQGNMTLRVGLHEIDRKIARELSDVDVAHSGGRAQAARTARAGRRHFQLNRRCRRADAGAGHQHHIGA